MTSTFSPQNEPEGPCNESVTTPSYFNEISDLPEQTNENQQECMVRNPQPIADKQERMVHNPRPVRQYVKVHDKIPDLYQKTNWSYGQKTKKGGEAQVSLPLSLSIYIYIYI